MAEKKKDTSTVTRITAQGSASPKKPATKAAKSNASTPKKNRKASGALKPFSLLIGYFKGAWFELTQVQWPNRRATWGMTLAVIAFTLFFVLMIVLLDAVFKYIFEVILG